MSRRETILAELKKRGVNGHAAVPAPAADQPDADLERLAAIFLRQKANAVQLSTVIDRQNEILAKVVAPRQESDYKPDIQVANHFAVPEGAFDMLAEKLERVLDIGHTAFRDSMEKSRLEISAKMSVVDKLIDRRDDDIAATVQAMTAAILAAPSPQIAVPVEKLAEPLQLATQAQGKATEAAMASLATAILQGMAQQAAAFQQGLAIQAKAIEKLAQAIVNRKPMKVETDADGNVLRLVPE